MDIDMAWLRGVALVTSNVPSLRSVCRLCACLGKPPVCMPAFYLLVFMHDQSGNDVSDDCRSLDWVRCMYFDSSDNDTLAVSMLVTKSESECCRIPTIWGKSVGFTRLILI